MTTILLFIMLFDSVILVAAVLLQAGQGGGLASLGGGAGTEVFMGGRQAVTILTRITYWTGGIFLTLALMIAILSARGTGPRSVLEGSAPPPAPVQSAPLTTPPATPPAQPPQQPPNR